MADMLDDAVAEASPAKLAALRAAMRAIVGDKATKWRNRASRSPASPAQAARTCADIKHAIENPE